MSACNIIATDEKGRPLGEARAVAVFMKGGMTLKIQPLHIEMNGFVHHLEMRTLTGSDTPGDVIHVIDMDRPVPVRHAFTMIFPVAQLHFESDNALNYV